MNFTEQSVPAKQTNTAMATSMLHAMLYYTRYLPGVPSSRDVINHIPSLLLFDDAVWLAA